MTKKLFATVLMMLTFFGITTVANANVWDFMGVYSDDYISLATATISQDTSSNININFTITGKNTMNKIGAKTIVLQKKTASANTWATAKTFSYEDYSNMLASNKLKYSTTVKYSSVESGYQYRAKVYFYAENGGYATEEVITNIITAK